MEIGLRIHRFLQKMFLVVKFVNMFLSAFHSTASMINTMSFGIFTFTEKVFLVWKYNIALRSLPHAFNHGGLARCLELNIHWRNDLMFHTNKQHKQDLQKFSLKA